MNELSIADEQSSQSVDAVFLQEILGWVLGERLGLPAWELGVRLVDPTEMARVNGHFLQHEGSTDVITFDYSDPAYADPSDEEPFPEGGIRGELYISVEDALEQADAFGTTWQNELVRYGVHGILHLLGYDDLSEEELVEMKSKENAIMDEVEGAFDLRRVEKRVG